MQVLWSGHDRAQWDGWHRTAAAALQQDWAYGEAMQSSGVRCLRARVVHEDRTLAIAQFIGRPGPWWAPGCCREHRSPPCGR